MKKMFYVIAILFIAVACSEDEPKNSIPSCEFTTPSNNDVMVVGTEVLIALNCQDEDGSISDVKLYINNIGVKGFDQFPYNYTWKTEGLDTGVYTIMAECEDDMGESASNEINIRLRLPDNVLPEVKFTAPMDSEEFVTGDIVSISFDADDTDGFLEEVKLNLDGEEIASFSQKPYYYNLNTTNIELGTHVLSATCLDDRGGSDTAYLSVIIKDLNITDIDGNTYKVVKIGDQFWMAENLRVTRYPNGKSIPNITSTSEWLALQNTNYEDAYCFYEGNTGDVINGALYSWAAAMGDNARSSASNPSGVQGACPDGYHIPSDAEWLELEAELGCPQSELLQVGWRGSGVGSKLKSEISWIDNGYGSNSSGFNAMASGVRSNLDGLFKVIGERSVFWTSQEISSTSAWLRLLTCEGNQIYRSSNAKKNGFSVRCVRD